MSRLGFVFLLLAGGGDAATGLALLVRPDLVAGLLGVAGGAIGEPGLRFVGSFVLAVGLAYLYPIALPPDPGRLRGVIEVTALVRSSVALALVAAVATHTVGPAWLLVAVFDGTLAVAQLALLRRGAFA